MSRRVDRLDQHVDARRRPPASAAQARFFEVGRRCASRVAPSARGRPSRARAGRRGRRRSRGRARRPLRNSASRPGRLAMPRSPCAKSPGGALNSTWARPCCLQRRGQGVGRPFVGKEELDRREAVGRGGGEAVEERVLDVHHAQVGGEARHGGSPRTVTSGRRTAAAQLVDLRRRQRCRRRLAAEPEARRLLAAPRAPPSPPPASRARRWARAAPASPRGSARRGAACADRRGDLIADARVARPVVGDQRHVADLHHEVRRDRRQEIVARLVRRVAQAGRHQVAWNGCG